MLRNNHVTDQLLQLFRDAEEEAVNDYRRGRVHNEDGITVSLLKALRTNRNFNAWGKNIRLEIDAYRAPDEPSSGADVAIRYQYLDSDSNIRYFRGIIAQAKMYDSSHSKLSDQCEKMIFITDESYVFTYSKTEIRVAPALPIYIDGGVGGKFRKYYSSQFHQFIFSYVQGFHGEQTIGTKLGRPLTASPLSFDYLLDLRLGISEKEGEQGEEGEQIFGFDTPDSNEFYEIPGQ